MATATKDPIIYNPPPASKLAEYRCQHCGRMLFEAHLEHGCYIKIDTCRKCGKPIVIYKP